jgi:orotidine-5'-phosphate decarboxylase
MTGLGLHSREGLFALIRQKASFLCVGLDPDVDRLPEGFTRDARGVHAFLEKIIAATAPFSVAYKPNFAFFEALGPEGMTVLQDLTRSIPDTHLIIGDAKRGDIGNTAARYAEAVFQQYGCHAITVAPYMGLDTLQPFLDHRDRWTIVLALTSNPGSADFQRLPLPDGSALWEEVLRACTTKGSPDQMMFVVGGTHPHDFRRVRELAPDHFLLVPGFGAQQGSLREVAHHGFNRHCGLLANVSRSILYASSGSDFAEAAAQTARQYQQEMQALLHEYHLLDPS